MHTSVVVLFLLHAILVDVDASCVLREGDMLAEVRVTGRTVDIELVNNNISPNSWTAVAFGPDMSDLELYLVKVKEDGRVTVQSGKSSGYEVPTLDSTELSTTSMQYNSGQLKVRFSRPIGTFGPRDHSFPSCDVISIVPSSPLSGDSISVHTSLPTQARICFNNCR